MRMMRKYWSQCNHILVENTHQESRVINLCRKFLKKKKGIKLMRIKRWPIKKMKSNPITLYRKSLFKKWCKGVFNSEVRVMLNIFFLHTNIRLNQNLVMPHQTGNWYSRWFPNKPTSCINFLPPFAHILYCFPQRSTTIGY